MRNKKGQFVKGESASPETQFKKGQTWRIRQPHWDKCWLENKYHNEKMSIPEIAKICNCTDSNISFWLKKHGIKGRTLSEARAIKYWGSEGDKNGMYGVKNEKNPNWKGGISSERAKFYSSEDWKKVVPIIFKRDNYLCQKCGTTHKNKDNALHIHHIVSFKEKELRCNTSNLILLCQKCHSWVHSKKNTSKEFILTKEQFERGSS